MYDTSLLFVIKAERISRTGTNHLKHGKKMPPHWQSKCVKFTYLTSFFMQMEKLIAIFVETDFVFEICYCLVLLFFSCHSLAFLEGNSCPNLFSCACFKLCFH